MRIGHGYDAHRFCENKELVIGGVKIESELGLLAHSDGDVLVHALIDSLLGAAGERDIGYNFPDNDSEYKNIDSCILLAKTAEILKNDGFEIEYADMTIIAQKPKLNPYLTAMREKMAAVLGRRKRKWDLPDAEREYQPMRYAFSEKKVRRKLIHKSTSLRRYVIPNRLSP